MRRDCRWPAEELEHHAQAWVYATEDPVAGIDQSSTRFRNTLFSKFKSLARYAANEKTYRGTTVKSARAKFDEIAADVQKFKAVLYKVIVCGPTFRRSFEQHTIDGCDYTYWQAFQHGLHCT